MNRRGRRPDASLFLIGVALLAVVAMETLSAAGADAGGGAPVVISDTDGHDPVGDGHVMAEGPTAVGSGRGGRGARAEVRQWIDRMRPGGQDDDAEAATEPLSPTGPLPMARVGELVVAAPVADPVVIGFHEASTRNGLDMRPLGALSANYNTTRFTEPLPSRAPAHPYVVLASRGRAPGPTTAADVVARPGDPIVSPVTGQVTDLRAYWLYGEHEDNRLEIRPDGDPSLRVVLVHVSGVTVGVGDRVTAGSTVVAAGATVFPFGSQIDRETEPDRFPHVHVEVQAFDAPRPGDDS